MQDEEVLARKSDIIVKMCLAGARVLDVIEEHAAEVDDIMLRLLERRIDAALRYPYTFCMNSALSKILQWSPSARVLPKQQPYVQTW